MTTIDRTTIFGGWIETTKPSIRLAHFADVSITDQWWLLLPAAEVTADLRLNEPRGMLKMW